MQAPISKSSCLRSASLILTGMQILIAYQISMRTSMEMETQTMMNTDSDGIPDYLDDDDDDDSCYNDGDENETNDFLDGNLPIRCPFKSSMPSISHHIIKDILETTISNDSLLTGIYPGWCIDLNTSMVNNHTFTAKRLLKL